MEFETGIPAGAKPAPYSEVDPGGGGGTTYTAHYEVLWWDPVDLNLNDTRANLTWGWNGYGAWIVARSADFPVGYQWHVQSSAQWDYSSPDGSFVQSRAGARFWNSWFCGWEVDTWANDIGIQGNYLGWQSGRIYGDIDYDKWTSCFPLHWSDQITPG